MDGYARLVCQLTAKQYFDRYEREVINFDLHIQYTRSLIKGRAKQKKIL